MKVAGVITEYNPFHNGHEYQLEQIKRQTSADYIVVVMSGDFVQRGEPAIIDKYELVDTLLFGSECPDLCGFKNIADRLSEESPAYQALLRQALQEGSSICRCPRKKP